VAGKKVRPQGANFDLWQELTREQHVANQELHRRRLRIDHVKSSVKRCRSIKDRSRLWKVGGRGGTFAVPSIMPSSSSSCGSRLFNLDKLSCETG